MKKKIYREQAEVDTSQTQAEQEQMIPNLNYPTITQPSPKESAKPVANLSKITVGVATSAGVLGLLFCSKTMGAVCCISSLAVWAHQCDKNDVSDSPEI